MIFHLPQRAILFLNQGFRVQKKSLAGRCQMHLARISLEELDSKLPFQDLNPQAEGGLSQVEACGGTAEMALIRDRYESPYVP
jgi:hypothetical protein